MEYKDNSDKKELKVIVDKVKLEDFAHLPETTTTVSHSDNNDDTKDDDEEMQENSESEESVTKEEEEEIEEPGDDNLADSSMNIEEKPKLTEDNEEMSCLLQEVSDAITNIDTVPSITNDVHSEVLNAEEETDEIMDSSTEIALEELEKEDDSDAEENSKLSDKNEVSEVNTVSNDPTFEADEENQKPDCNKSNETNEKNEEGNNTEVTEVVDDASKEKITNVISNLPKEDILDFTADDYDVIFPSEKVESLHIDNDVEEEEGNAEYNDNTSTPIKQRNKNIANQVISAKNKRRKQKYRQNKINFKRALSHITTAQDLKNICKTVTDNQEIICDEEQAGTSQTIIQPDSLETNVENSNELVPSENEKWVRIKQRPKGNKQRAKNMPYKKKPVINNQNDTMKLIKEVLNYVKLTTKQLLPNIDPNFLEAGSSGTNTMGKKNGKNAGKYKNMNKQGAAGARRITNSSQQNIVGKNLSMRKNKGQVINSRINPQNTGQNKGQMIKNRNNPNARIPQQNIRSNQLVPPRKQNNKQKNQPWQQFNDRDFVSNNPNTKQNNLRKKNPPRNQQRNQHFNNTPQQYNPNIQYKNVNGGKQRKYNVNSRNSQNRNNSSIPSLLYIPPQEFEMPPTRNRSNQSLGKRSYLPNHNSNYNSQHSGSYEFNRQRERSISPEYQSRRNIPQQSFNNPRNMPTATYVPGYHIQERAMNVPARINVPRMRRANLNYNDRSEQFNRPPMRTNEPRRDNINYNERNQPGRSEQFKRPASSPTTYSPNKKKKFSNVEILREKEALLLKMKHRDRMLKELESAQREINTSLEALSYI